MDFESPDVEKDFPGLYASESGRKSNESDFSDGGDHEKPSKKDLLGRRKDKKEKKDRGYAALEGESSPEEDTDTKSPSKTKKTKSFKFPTKSKEKREKSRDKEKVVEDITKQKELSEKEKKKEREREKEREKEKKEKEKREKLREKDKEKEEKAKFKLESKEKLKDDKKEKVKDKDKEKVKEKDKEKIKEKEKEKVKEKEKEKVKEKDKDKKDKKLIKMPSTVTSGIPFEEIFTLGVALPIFGVPLHQSVERSRCHDDTGLPLVMRDSIDFLQAHGLKSPQIYRAEPDKIKLQQLRKLYTDRGPTFPYHWDVPVACAMLKTFISELPESILTQELFVQFEQATALGEPAREAALRALALRLPAHSHAALAWLLRHLHDVLAHEAVNHASMSVLCSALCPSLGVSHSLLAALVSKADKLFPDVRLTKYVPPLLSIPSDFPETSNEISEELRKQESLLNQIHFEMHAGFITSTRDQQLWEAQRIVTQLKRKLRSVQKSVEPNAFPTHQPSIEEKPEEEAARGSSQNEPLADEVEVLPQLTEAFPEVKESPNDPTFPVEFEDNFEFKPNKDSFDFKPDKDSFDFKPAQDSLDFKPPKDSFDFKPAKDSLEFKPPKDSFDFKPAKDSLEFKPPKDSFDFKPAKDSLEFKPPKDSFDFKPAKDSLEFKPPKDSFDFKPAKDSLEFKPPKDSFDFKPAKDSLEFKPPKDSFDFKPDKDSFDFKPNKDSFDFKPDEDSFDFKPDEDSFDFKQAEDKFNFPPTEDEFDFNPEPKETENKPGPIIEKPKFTDKELQVLRLQLENAEYLQLKSLLQAKINSEQFEIVKLRSHVTLKNKQEGNNQNNKENKDSNTPEEQELRQKLIKENAMLEQKRQNLLNQIFQERIACIHLKIELAMKEILTKS